MLLVIGPVTKVVCGVEKATPNVGSLMQQLNSVESVYMWPSGVSLWGLLDGCTILVCVVGGLISVCLEWCPVPQPMVNSVLVW